MSNYLYDEIRRCCDGIEETNKEITEEVRLEEEKGLLEAVKLLIKSSGIARDEGILALEEFVMELPDEPPTKYAKQMLNLAVDGTEPTLLENIAMFRYSSSRITGYQGLIYLVYVRGVQQIQAGVHPRIIEEELLSMLPENVAGKYTIEEVILSDVPAKSVEDLYEGNLVITPSHSGYAIMRFLDLTLQSLDDRYVQRVLREIDEYECMYVMKGISGKGRKKILTNVSKGHAVTLADNMASIGPIRINDSVKAGIKLTDIIYKLVSTGEIVIKNCDEMVLLDRAFSTDKEVLSNTNERDTLLMEVRRLTDDILGVSL